MAGRAPQIIACELGLWRLTAHKIAEVFGTRLRRNHRGKLSTIIDQVDHGHHVFRAYFKNAAALRHDAPEVDFGDKLETAGGPWPGTSTKLYPAGLKPRLGSRPGAQRAHTGLRSLNRPAASAKRRRGAP